MSVRKRRTARKGSAPAKASADVEALLAQAIPCMQIESVRQEQGTFAAGPRSGPPRKDPLLASVETEVSRDRRRLLSRVHFDFQAPAPVSQDPVPCAHVTATWALSYRILEGAEISKQALTAFSRVNALHNAWPYWREFVQHALQRLELPPLALPLVRVEQLIAWAEGGARAFPR